MTAVTAPSPTVRQMSGYAPDGQLILSVLVKRTYRIGGDGRLTDAEEPLPLAVEARASAENARLLETDTDLYPFKLATDVVVKGHAYGAGRPSFEASVRVGSTTKRLLVMGDRRCALGAKGAVRFSKPEPCDRIPLRYDRAYGGVDAAAQGQRGAPFNDLRPYVASDLRDVQASPYAYPRNPAGCGYLIDATAKALDGLRLPNLEDPDDPLSPDRLVAGHWRKWPDMPVPAGVDWVDLGWFPRIAYFGAVPEHDPPPVMIAEVARGFAPRDVLTAAPLAEKFSFRCASGASLGLQLPYLRGDEPVELVHMHASHARLAFQLPAHAPRVWIDGRKAGLVAATPVVHTLLIEPDLERVAIVWRGAGPALRGYLPDELDRMPLRVEW
jgi:hypothetical protein